MDVSSISTYTDYLTKQNTKADELKNTLNKTDYSEADDEKLLDACKQFESYMIEQMYKNMEKASKILTEDEDDDSTSSQYVDMFHDNYIQTIAESMTNSGQSIGLADQLYNAIKKNEGTQV